MTWFRVDDSFPQHPKLEALEGDAVEHALAIAAWTLMGADCAARRTDGHFTERRLARVLPWPEKLRGKARDALLRSGLWKASGDGFLFHDWPDYQPTKAELDADRKAATERQRRWRESRRKAKNGDVDASRNTSQTALVDGRVDATAITSAHTPHAPSHVDASLTPPRPVPSRPVPSKQEHIHTSVSEPPPSPRAPRSDVVEVFELWKELCGKSPGTKLDDKRERRIKWAISTYGLDATLRCVRGYAKSDFHMGRDPKTNGKRYDGIGLMLRDAEHFEAGLELLDSKPRPSGGNGKSARLPAGTGKGFRTDLDGFDDPPRKQVGYG